MSLNCIITNNATLLFYLFMLNISLFLTSVLYYSLAYRYFTFVICLNFYLFNMQHYGACVNTQALSQATNDKIKSKKMPCYLYMLKAIIYISEMNNKSKTKQEKAKNIKNKNNKKILSSYSIMFKH